MMLVRAVGWRIVLSELVELPSCKSSVELQTILAVLKVKIVPTTSVVTKEKEEVLNCH